MSECLSLSSSLSYTCSLHEKLWHLSTRAVWLAAAPKRLRGLSCRPLPAQLPGGPGLLRGPGGGAAMQVRLCVHSTLETNLDLPVSTLALALPAGQHNLTTACFVSENNVCCLNMYMNS